MTKDANNNKMQKKQGAIDELSLEQNYIYVLSTMS